MTLKSKLYKVKGKICNRVCRSKVIRDRDVKEEIVGVRRSKVVRDKDIKEEIKGCLRPLYY